MKESKTKSIQFLPCFTSHYGKREYHQLSLKRVSPTLARILIQARGLMKSELLKHILTIGKLPLKSRCKINCMFSQNLKVFFNLKNT